MFISYHHGKRVPCNSQRNLTEGLPSMSKEALDSGGQVEKEELEEVSTEFEQITEWMKGVRGD